MSLKHKKYFACFLTCHMVAEKMELKPLKKLPDPRAWVGAKRKDGSAKREPSQVTVTHLGGSSVPMSTKDANNSTKMLGVNLPLWKMVYHKLKPQGRMGCSGWNDCDLSLWVQVMHR